MPLPIPNLDDRRFDDLVAEMQARLTAHLPELTQLAPGDPVHSFIDLFAWLTETILYRANLIPERQRRVFLNLLQIPVRPARPASGVVCIDANASTVRLPPVLAAGAQLKGGKQTFTTLGEVQPTPLQMTVSIKETIDIETLQSLGFTVQDLHEQYGLRTGEKPVPFQPRSFEPDKESMGLTGSLDKAYYLAFSVPPQLEDRVEDVRNSVAGIILNIAIAPADDMECDEIHELRPRQLIWELLSEGEEGEVIFLPLEIVHDSSNGGRKSGVVRLRLPRNPALFATLGTDDSMFAGLGDLPPELPAQMPIQGVVFWLRLRSEEEPDLPLTYLGVNGIDIIGQGLKRDVMVGIGTGAPDQIINLPDANIDLDSIELDVEENGAWKRWQRVDFLFGLEQEDCVYRLDAATGYVYFGNGLSGKRPPQGRRIRIAAYRFGGGAAGNLAAGDIKELSSSEQLILRHELACRGGIDAETVEQAEQRIPQFLTHRNRAVTEHDFTILCERNPVNPVGRAEVMKGFLPGASIRAARENVPGVVSVFVLPPGEPVLGNTPKPTKGMLKDVFQYLLNRVVIGTELYVLSPEFVPIAVGVRVEVRDPETEQQTLRMVREALLTYLWSLMPGGAQGEGWPMGLAVRTNELMTQVARVEGVQAVNAMCLFRREQGLWRRIELNQSVELELYQLPELMGVSVGTGTGDADFPGGLGPLAGEEGGSGWRDVPAPVIPDVC